MKLGVFSKGGMLMGGRVVLYAASAFLVSMFLLSLCLVNNSYAFELSAATDANNHGYSCTYTSSSGELRVVLPSSDDSYAASFDGQEVDSVLSIPDYWNEEPVQAVTFSCPISVTNGSLKLASATYIKEVVFPRGAKTIYTLVTTPNPVFGVGGFINLESISFRETGEWALALVSNIPSTLTRFNAGIEVVDGQEVSFDCRIPSSVTGLNDEEFANCGITSLYVPESVTSWSSTAFSGCDKLTYVVSDASVFPIVPDVEGQELIIRGNVTSIPAGAFAGSSKEEITLPEGITVIPENAFLGCENLKQVEIPAGVTTIGPNAFSGCTSLESITFDGQETLTVIEHGAFMGSGLKTFVVPEGVVRIGFGAFAHSDIESIVLPSTLWDGMSFAEQGGDFNKDPSGTNIADTTGQTGHVSYGAQMFVNSAMAYIVNSDLWNTSLKYVDLSNYNKDTIPYYMFAGCAALEEVRLPACVRTLQEGAFADCTALQRVYLYNANPSIAGAGSSGDTGNSSTGEGGWVEYYPSAFGYHLYAQPDADLKGSVNGQSIANIYAVNTDMTLYGVGFKQNSLLDYAEKYGCEFVPFAFLGEGGSSEDVVSLFGYEMPANMVSVEDIQVGEEPVFTLGYQDEEISRVLEPGADCTVRYFNSFGVEVELPLAVGGTYTAEITGDGDSVWGTTTVTFTVEGTPCWVSQNGGLWLDEGAGAYPANCWKEIQGSWFRFDADGWVQTGWVKDGAWYYLGTDGVMAHDCWVKDGGSWYYLGSDGAMLTGWVLDDGEWYYLDASGAMATGWVKWAGSWYYLQPSGAMLTGWLSWGGSWYYLAESGAMATGWVLDGGEWYYLTGSGEMATGWVNDGGAWYYLYGSGVMAHDCWVGDYYLTSSGAMAVSAWVDGGRYYVGPDGAWVPGA